MALVATASRVQAARWQDFSSIERPVAALLMVARTRPTRDFTCATAVAVAGRTLSGNAMMNGFTCAQILAPALRRQDFWRQEFVRLVGVADGLAPQRNDR